MKDFSFLRPVFWHFWHQKWDMHNNSSNPNEWDSIETENKLREYGFNFGYEDFQKCFIEPFTGTKGDMQLQRMANILSKTLKNDPSEYIYKMSRKKIGDLEALEWTFVQTVNLNLSGLDLFTPLNREQLELGMLPFDQCWLCGKNLPKAKHGSRRKFCHWPSCPTSEKQGFRNTANHRKTGKDDEHCCWAKLDNLIRNRKAAINRFHDQQENASSTFVSLLESLYSRNLANSNNLYSIRPQIQYGGADIYTIAEHNKQQT